MALYFKLIMKTLLFYYCCYFSTAWATACSIDVTSLNFGRYDPTSAKPTTAAGTVKTTCRGRLVDYQINFTPGRGRSYQNRKMQGDGGGVLRYNLFTNPSHTIIWGNGTSGTGAINANSGSCGRRASCVYPVYGYIPPRQKVPAGRYSDVIVVVFTF